jgi:[ribosomal protein S5]-alanine N-acetyltransferase
MLIKTTIWQYKSSRAKVAKARIFPPFSYESGMKIETERLRLALQSAEEVREFLSQMSPEVRAQVSPAWLDLLNGTTEPDPWVHGFTIADRETNARVGKCGFTGGPNSDGLVEIAYAIEPAQQGKGYATEAAAALTRFALGDSSVRKVIAHTLPEVNASTRVLTKCGFRHTGELVHPEDGLVWRWEFPRP